MNNSITIKNYIEPPVDLNMIFHYAGGNDHETEQQIKSLLNECLPLLSYKIVYCRLPITVENTLLDLNFATICSSDLSKALQRCNEIILFAATIGIQIDRLISKYSRLSPYKGLLMQAIGTERIESLCNAFCKEISLELHGEGMKVHPRFSPGYGDLSLSIQNAIINRLETSKNIGITLNSQLLMTPSKSVTAIIGLEKINEH